MKRAFVLFLVVSILLCAVPANAKTSYIVSLEDFVYRFNLLSSLVGDSHTFDDKNAEIITTFDDTILKAIYHDCEVLSLFMNDSLDEITSISCTLTSEKGANEYMSDYIFLLVLVFYAAGMDDAASGDYFTEVASMINNGTRNYETTVDGINVTYTQSDAFGITFKLEKL